MAVEFDKEDRKMSELLTVRDLPDAYPADFNMSRVGCLILYAIIIRYRPDVVLETGIANGYSTRIILSALNKNKHGRLISVEISKKVGALLGKTDTSRWTLVVDEPAKNLLRALGIAKSVDVFIHDSDHTYENMLFELKYAYKKMSKHGFIMSDDVNQNAAFIEFSKRVKTKPLLFPSLKKTFGVIEIKK